MSEHLTPEDRDRLRGLAENATPGPWEYPGELLGLPCTTVLAGDPKRTHAAYVAEMGPQDGAFIAAARTAVPALLDMLEKAEAERDKYIHLIGVLAEQVAAREANQEQGRMALDRVRELHQPCNHDAPCRGDCAECGQHMPCDTIRALDDDQ